MLFSFVDICKKITLMKKTKQKKPHPVSFHGTPKRAYNQIHK